MSAVWMMVAFQNTSSTVSMALRRRTTARPHLRYEDGCVRDMKVVDIDTMSWVGLAADRTKWRSALKQHLKTGEEKLMAAAAENEHAERRAAAPSDLRPHIVVMSARKTATPTLVCSASSDVATSQQLRRAECLHSSLQ